ncbi:hypothetical protein INR49_007074 [Caranx melampygus]|nr:hypothetical protein INR49_007074 [Caranx melampygus]
MDRRRMDAEGSSAVHREWRATKLAVVVVAQNLLVAACLLVTLYIYWSVQSQLQEQASAVNVHIRFGPIATISGNATLRFPYTKSMRMMSVAGQNNDTIHINCTGPYILDVDLCYKSLGKEESTGVLQLEAIIASPAPSTCELHKWSAGGCTK